jgi:hypothetical protein
MPSTISASWTRADTCQKSHSATIKGRIIERA